jgi:hypothetical protein
MYIRWFMFFAILLSVLVIFWRVHYNDIPVNRSTTLRHLTTDTVWPAASTISRVTGDIKPHCGYPEHGCCPS